MTTVLDVGLSKCPDGRWAFTIFAYTVESNEVGVERNIDRDKTLANFVQYFDEKPVIVTGDEL